MSLLKSAVEAFVLDTTVPPPPGTVAVHGDPIHLDPEALAARARAQGAAALGDHEMRHAVGNHLTMIADATGISVVTAPGYCGGYLWTDGNRTVAGTLMAEVLGRMPEVRMDDFGLAFYLGHAPKSAFQQMPLSTMIAGLTRLPPASLLRIEGGRVVRHQSLLPRIGALGRPGSFARAMGEVADALAADHSRRGARPAILFSGGVDSLVIYLALRARMGAEAIRLFTMDLSPHNGLGRAVPVAASLGAEIDYVDSDNLFGPRTLAALPGLMARDIVNTRGPHMGLIEEPVEARDILHGQNMDALANGNMTVLHANLDRPYFNEANPVAELSPANKVLHFSRFIGNLAFTDPYLSDPVFQRETAAFFASLAKGLVPDPDPGGAGTLRGMLASQVPNLLPQMKFPVDQIAGLDRELALLGAHGALAAARPGLSVDRLRFLTYGHLANKRNASLPLPGGGRPLLVPMSGPIVSHFLGRSRGLSDAGHPKREIYAYVEAMTGRSYGELMQGQKNALMHLAATPREDDPLIEAHRARFAPEASPLVAGIGDPGLRGRIAKLYAQIRTGLDQGTAGLTPWNRSRARQLLNLEFILSTAAGIRAAPGEKVDET